MFGCVSNTTPPLELNCSVDIEILKENIKSITNADTVLIYTKNLREEMYFPEIRCPVIIIENATTKTLDFKILPIDKYRRFDNFSQIEDMLWDEAEPLARMISGNCDMGVFNDLIIEFIKRDYSGHPMYHFICHYDELIMVSEK